jgi:hypothetical protein
MAAECSRLGHKVSKAVELRISRVIQECQICKDKDMILRKNPGSLFARSLQRLTAGNHYAQERGAPITLGEGMSPGTWYTF